MAFATLMIILAVLVTASLWVLLRNPQSTSRPRQSPVKPRSVTPVSQPSAKGAHSAELPVVQSETSGLSAGHTRTIPEALALLHLVVAADIDDAVSQRIDSICTNMPEPHPVQQQLACGLDTPEELMVAVASDAGLTANILRTVNSPAFFLTSPITSVQHAITYLGVSVVKGLVAQAAVTQQVDESTPEQQAALSRIWRSACTASAIAQMLAQELGVERPSVLATQALFFNLGDVALVLSVDAATAWYADDVGIVERINGQQSVCSANTAIIGARLARKWRLPDDIADAIECGLIPLVTLPEEHPMKGDAQRANVLMYLAGRIGDRVIYRGLRNIGDLELVDSQEPGLFHLAGHLDVAGLGRVPALLQDPAFKRKANRVLSTFGA